MDTLTPKQSSLLNYIYLYRYNHGRTPSLKEMVARLDVSDNKSLLRMIDSLIEKEYLSRETKKTKTVTLSDKGYRLVSGIPFKYEKPPSELDKASLPTELGRSGISVSLPTSNTLGYQEEKLGVNGTSGGIDIDTIIETAVTLAIGKYLSGTKLGHNLKTDKNHHFIDVVNDIVEKNKALEQL